MSSNTTSVQATCFQKFRSTSFQCLKKMGKVAHVTLIATALAITIIAAIGLVFTSVGNPAAPIMWAAAAALVAWSIQGIFRAYLSP